MQVNKRFALHTVVVIFFALMTFLILHMLLFQTGTKFAGFDYFTFHWDMWWIRHVLTTPGLNLYQTNNVFAPSINNLGYHALTAFWFPLWVLVEPVAGPFAAMNAIIALACFLNGYLFFVLLRSERISVGLSLLAGAVLQTLPITRYFYFNTHINLMDWFWLPTHLLLWKQIVAAVNAGQYRRAIGWSIAQGIAVWGLTLTDLQFPIFVAFLLVPYGLITLWRSGKRRQLIQLISAGMIIVGLALALLWFAGPLPYILTFRGTLVPSPAENRPGIPFPSGYLSMSPTWWQWNTPSLGSFVSLALLASLALNLLPLRKVMSRNCWIWFALMLVPLILSMGPTVTVAGLAIPMPFRLFYALTKGMFGMPWRLAPIYVIAALVFVGYTWTPVLKNAGKWQVWIFAAAFCVLGADIRLFENGPLDPLPPTYKFYEAMAKEPNDDYVVLEIPTGVGTGEILVGDPRAIELQFYTTIHGKRTVNGFISRAPVENFWRVYVDDPLLAWLGQRRPLIPDTIERLLRERIFSWPIGYLVIHKDILGETNPAVQEIVGYFNGLPDLVCPVWIEGDAIVYRTVWHPAGCPPRTPPETEQGVYRIDLGASGDEEFTGGGWYWPEAIPGGNVRWSGAQPDARIYVDLPKGAYRLTINMQAFYRQRRIQVQVNHKPVGSITVPETGLKTFSFDVPVEIIRSTPHTVVTLTSDSADNPADVGQGNDARKLSVMVDWIQFNRVEDF